MLKEIKLSNNELLTCLKQMRNDSAVVRSEFTVSFYWEHINWENFQAYELTMALKLKKCLHPLKK